jgi:hypothetical protein
VGGLLIVQVPTAPRRTTGATCDKGKEVASKELVLSTGLVSVLNAIKGLAEIPSWRVGPAVFSRVSTLYAHILIDPESNTSET